VFKIDRIEGMSPEQEARLYSFYETLLSDSYSTDTIDELALESAIGGLYRFIGEREPAVVWCESPWQTVVMPVLLQLHFKLGPQSPLWHEIEDSLKLPLWAKCKSRLLEAADTILSHANAAGERSEDRSPGDEILTVPGLPTWRSSDWPYLGMPLGERLNVPLQQLLPRLESELQTRVDFELIAKIRPEVTSVFVPPYLRLRTQLRHALEGEASGRINRLRRRGSSERPWVTHPNLASVPLLGSELVRQLDGRLRTRLASRLGRSDEFPGFNAVSGAGREELEAMLEERFNTWFDLAFWYLDWWPSRVQWLSFFVFPLAFPTWSLYSEELMTILETWLALARGGFVYTFLSRVCFVCDRPVELGVDPQRRLHNSSGPAIAFTDSYKLYSWHGVTVPASIICDPEAITFESITNEQNLEVRRVLIERYGQVRYLKDAGAVVADSDASGTLYMCTFPDDEPLMMVEVKNATPEPDGSFRTYFLRVPPQMASARQAVAWTFGLSEKEYAPNIET